jgi:DNA ligase-1
MFLPTLYKRTNTGAVQEWTIHIENDQYRTVSGQVQGKLIENSPVKTIGKNVGKANETSASDQAQLEAQAKWKKKTEEGYTENIEDIDTAGGDVIKPMLAKDYKEHLKKVKFPVYSQPKLDGLRCVITRTGAWSRNWKPFMTLKHLKDALAGLFEEYPEIEAFDGEVYNHELKDDFNSLVSLVKQPKPTEEDIRKASEMVEYHIYDVIPVGAPSFEKRNKRLLDIFKRTSHPKLKYVSTTRVKNQDDLDDLMGAYLEDGYEGQMIRDLAGLYENKRTDKLLKRKEFVDGEWPIIGYKEGKGNRIGCIVLRCKTASGAEFDCSVKGSIEYTRRLWNNRDKLLGKMATVKYQRLTPDGIPKFLTCIKFRDTSGEELVF